MAIRWRPDTCDCVIVVHDWDAADNGDPGIHLQFEHSCELHESIESEHARYKSVRQHNKENQK